EKSPPSFQIVFQTVFGNIRRAAEYRPAAHAAPAFSIGKRECGKTGLAGTGRPLFPLRDPYAWRKLTGRPLFSRPGHRFSKKCRPAGNAAICFEDSNPGRLSH